MVIGFSKDLILRGETPLQKELNRKSKLTDEELLVFGKKLFPSPVSEVVAEGRDR